MTTDITAPVSERYALFETPVNAGSLVPVDGGSTARGQQVHNRLWALQSSLVPKDGYDDSNLATTLWAGQYALAAFGGVYAAVAGIVAASGGDSKIGLVVAGASLACSGVCWALRTLGKHVNQKQIVREVNANAAQVAELGTAFTKLSGVERDVVAYRGQRLLRGLADSGASAPYRDALGGMHDSYYCQTAVAREQVDLIGQLVESIVLPTGEIAPGARRDTERLTHSIENLSSEARTVVANLVRAAVQIAVDTNDGHRWRLQRLLEALDGTRSPYASEETSEAESTALATILPNQDVTLDRCITLLKGGLAAERGANDPAYAQTTLIPSTNPRLAEQVAAHFEHEGYRAAIFDNGLRLVVSVFEPSRPPSGAFIRGAAL